MLNLINEYLAAKAEADAAAARLDKAKKDIIATGREWLDGNEISIKVTLSEASNLDTKKARGYLTEAQIAACTGKVLRTTITVKPRRAEAA